MPVWKNQCITRDVYREILIQKFLPALKEKWPTCNGRIRLQQDGAKSHILEEDMEFKEAVDEIGLNLTVLHNCLTRLTLTFAILVFSEPYSRSTMIALPMRKN